MGTTTEYSPEDVIANLIDKDTPFNPQFLHFFSDITFDNLNKIKAVWVDIENSRKINLLKDLETLMETDTLISLDDFGFFAIEDNDPQIKSRAIHLFWDTNNIKLISIFFDFFKNSLHQEVKQAAASALGRFVLLGELDEIPEDLSKKVQDFLVEQYLIETNVQTRQRILESLGYSSNNKVNQFIMQALKEDEKDWQLSALLAISRSADGEWGKVVMQKLSDIDPDIQTEAIKAAGELEIASAKEKLIKLLLRSESYEEAHLQSIWALAKIGGSDVVELLEELIEESEDEEEIEILEMALENLDLLSDMSSIDTFNPPD